MHTCGTANAERQGGQYLAFVIQCPALTAPHSVQCVNALADVIMQGVASSVLYWKADNCKTTLVSPCTHLVAVLLRDRVPI